VVVEVERDDPLVLTEQMMPILPVVRVRDADEGIDLAKATERGCRHTAVMHSKNLDHLSRMAREMDCSIFVKNGFPTTVSATVARATARSPSPARRRGLTSPVSFSRIRRCVLKDSFRIRVRESDGA